MKQVVLRHFGFVLALAGTMLAPADLLRAADVAYPSKPILFITHSGPGGGMDTMLRRMTDIMATEKLVSQQMRVENVRGGSGAKAMTTLVKRKGEDHLLAGMTTVWIAAPLISPDVKVSYRDMTPVALLGMDPNIVVVRADSPYKSVRELLDFAKAYPKKLKQAGASVTSTPNFDRIAIEEATGAAWDYVAFPSGGQAITALLGGHVHLVIGQPADIAGHLRAGTPQAVGEYFRGATRRFSISPNPARAGHHGASLARDRARDHRPA